MRTAHPYLNFPGNAEEAFEFYAAAIGTEIAAITRFRDFGHGMGVAEKDLDLIANIALPIGDQVMLMATDSVAFGDSVPELKMGNNFYVMLDAESGAEADRVFAALSDGGSVEMPLQRTEWAEKYGTLKDRFGVQWMVGYTGSVVFTPGSG